MRKSFVFLAVVFLLLLGATPALAQGIPKLPHAFYGSVTIDGAAAPDGIQISATVDIGEIISTQNPVATVGGKYGVGSPYLLVQGYDIPDGATITFHVTNVNGAATGGTASFVAGGGPTRHDIDVTIAVPTPTPTPSGGEGGAAPLPTIGTNLFGTAGTYSISSTGVIQRTITATSADGKLTITIPQGTIALDKDGRPLTSLTAVTNSNPSTPPAGKNIIGLAYEFSPAGATFNPPITFTWNYDPGTLPAGVDEKDLVLAYYDTASAQWVELPSTVNTTTHTITASVSHFTTFAILAPVPVAPPAPTPAAFSLSNLTVQPAEVQPGEAVTITVAVANTGGTEGSYTVVLNLNGTKETEKSVTVASGASEVVTFSVSKEVVGSYSVTVDGLSASFTVLAPAPPAPPTPAPPTKPAAPTNWPLIGGIIVAAIVVVLLVIFLLRRRAD